MISFEPIVKHFISIGTAQLEATIGQSRNALASKITDVERRWNGVSSKVKDRQECISSLLPICRQYNESFESLLAWLKTANNEIKAIMPIANDQENLVQQQRVVEVS